MRRNSRRKPSNRNLGSAASGRPPGLIALVLVLQDQQRPEEARTALAQAIQATGARAEYRDLLP